MNDEARSPAAAGGNPSALAASAAFAAGVLVAGRGAMAAGAWLAIAAMALAPLAIAVLVRLARTRGTAPTLSAADAEAIAWLQSGGAGPRGGLPVRTATSVRPAGLDLEAGPASP